MAVEYRAMTPLEIRACKSLANCTFLPGSAHKRFAKDLGYVVEHADPPMISTGQAAHLWRMVYRYRRQIGSEKLQNLALAQNLWNEKKTSRKNPTLCPECGSDGVMSDVPERGVCNICGHAWDNRTESDYELAQKAHHARMSMTELHESIGIFDDDK